MKLRTKFGLILVVVMLVLSGVVLGSVELFKQETIEQERADLSDAAELTAQQVKESVLNKKNTMSEYVIRSSLTRFNDTEPKVQRFLDETDFDQARVVSANGTIVEVQGDELTRSQRDSLVGRDASDQDYFQESMNGTRYVELLGPSQIQQTDRRFILFSVPIGLSEEGEGPRGVLVAGFYVYPSPEQRASEATTFFDAVVTQERETQAVRIVGENVSGSEVVLREPKEVFNDSLTETEAINTGGGKNWGLTIVRDRSGLDDRIRILQGVQFVSLMLVLGAVLGMGYWEYSTNLTQTAKLLDGFRALEGGDFEYTLSLESAEEWEQISDGFNQMATGIREREQAIREREQRLGVLNRVLRHNLQNDMNVILSYAEMLPELGENEQDEAVETIVSKGKGLVAHGKKARQIEEAMQAAENGLVEHDLTVVVTDVLDDLREEYPDATIETDLPESVPVAAIESLHFAVEAVAENGLEHNDSDDPLLRISAEPGADAVTLATEDNGPGIPEYEQQVVMEGEETSLEHGSGLGLFLATWVTEKSNGVIVLETPADGGTTVTLTLPPASSIDDREFPAE